MILNRIIAIIVAASFSIVGILYKLGMIDGKDEGHDAFKGVFVVLLNCALVIYFGIRKFRECMISWPLAAKIIVVSILGVMFIGFLMWSICDYTKIRF